MMVRRLRTARKFAALTGVSQGARRERLSAAKWIFRWAILSAVLVLAFHAAPSTAQSRPAAKTAGGVKILLLGTAGGPPLHLNRSEPSSLLVVDGHRYLIDCGIGTMRRLLQAGIPSQTIGTIFITHHHPDHDLGLVDVLGNDFFISYLVHPPGAFRRFNIYGPPQTKELVEDAFRYISVPYRVSAAEQPAHNLNLPDPFVAHEFNHNGVVYRDSRIRVVAAENTHYALMPARFRVRMKSYSYRFETPEGVVVFTGDTGPSEAVVRLAKGADVLISEVDDLAAIEQWVNGLARRNHWKPGQTKYWIDHMKAEHLDFKHVGELATKAKVKAVVLYHFVPVPKDPATYVAGVKKYYSGPVYAGADLHWYCLGGQGGQGKNGLHPCH